MKIPDFLRFTPRVALLIRRNVVGSEVCHLAQALYTYYLEGRPMDKVVEQYMRICYNIDLVKQKTVGKGFPTTVSNALMRAIAYTIAVNVSVPDDDAEDFDKLAEQFRQSRDHRTRWFYMKARVLYLAIIEVQRTRRFIARFRSVPSHHMRDAALQSMDSLDAYISQMMEQLAQIRKYGVKPAYFDLASPSNAKGDAWVFWGYRDFMGRKLKSDGGAYIAQIALAPKKELVDLRPIHETEAGPDGTLSEWVEVPFLAHFMWSMEWDGNFDLGGGQNQHLVRTLFQKEDKELEYHGLRVMLMFCLYDLIAPLEVVATMPSLGNIASSFTKPVSEKQQVDMSPVMNLIVPRIRALENIPGVIRQLEQEVLEGEQETERRRTILRRRHEVTAHIRRLPEGRKASPMARLHAREEFGIELAPGETFVVTHVRGTGKEITSHRAKARRV